MDGAVSDMDVYQVLFICTFVVSLFTLFFFVRGLYSIFYVLLSGSLECFS
jgi:hypothetical protein